MKKHQRHLLASFLTLAATSAATTYANPGYNSGQALPATYSQTIIAANKGVVANDGRDDAKALQDIIDGIRIDNAPSNLIRILLPKGEINISDEIHVDRSGIVIEGAGNNPETGTKIVVTSWKPYGVDGKNAPDFDKKFWPGFAAFRTETRIMHPKKNEYEGGINFHWNHSIELEKPARLGDTVIAINQDVEDNFSVGDLVYVGAASDSDFINTSGIIDSKRTNSSVRTGHMRTQIFKVVAINTQTDEITIDKPLEFDIALQGESGYNSRVMPVKAVENVGYRNFYMTMDNAGTDCADLNEREFGDSNPNGVRLRYLNLCAESAIHGLIFKWTYNGFVENVKVEMIGSHPIVTEFAKNMTFKDNLLDGSWNKGAGGNGYFRGSKLYDSVIDGNRIENLRHLTLQWSATGNVVKNNYLNVDINLHGGWERNNIIHNNTSEIPFEHRSWDTKKQEPSDGTWQPVWYGSGDHATNWSGPTGPNNIIVNNNFKKALSTGARINRWNLFDEPGTKYTFAWDGEAFDHINVRGQDVDTWTQAIAEDVASDIPNTGVLVEFINNNDLDNDGVLNNNDRCPATAMGTDVNGNGCNLMDNDTDGDGIPNGQDSCPNTTAGTQVDTTGCEIIDGDDDNDNVLNSVDQCPNTRANADVDAQGCEIIDGDDDNDNVLNSADQCPNTRANADVDTQGCEIIDTTDDSSGNPTPVDNTPDNNTDDGNNGGDNGSTGDTPTQPTTPTDGNNNGSNGGNNGSTGGTPTQPTNGNNDGSNGGNNGTTGGTPTQPTTPTNGNNDGSNGGNNGSTGGTPTQPTTPTTPTTPTNGNNDGSNGGNNDSTGGTPTQPTTPTNGNNGSTGINQPTNGSVAVTDPVPSGGGSTGGLFLFVLAGLLAVRKRLKV